MNILSARKSEKSSRNHPACFSSEREKIIDVLHLEKGSLTGIELFFNTDGAYSFTLISDDPMTALFQLSIDDYRHDYEEQSKNHFTAAFKLHQNLFKKMTENLSSTHVKPTFRNFLGKRFHQDIPTQNNDQRSIDIRHKPSLSTNISIFTKVKFNTNLSNRHSRVHSEQNNSILLSPHSQASKCRTPLKLHFNLKFEEEQNRTLFKTEIKPSSKLLINETKNRINTAGVEKSPSLFKKFKKCIPLRRMNNLAEKRLFGPNGSLNLERTIVKKTIQQSVIDWENIKSNNRTVYKTGRFCLPLVVNLTNSNQML